MAVGKFKITDPKERARLAAIVNAECAAVDAKIATARANLARNAAATAGSCPCPRSAAGTGRNNAPRHKTPVETPVDPWAGFKAYGADESAQAATGTATETPTPNADGLTPYDPDAPIVSYYYRPPAPAAVDVSTLRPYALMEDHEPGEGSTHYGGTPGRAWEEHEDVDQSPKPDPNFPAPGTKTQPNAGDPEWYATVDGQKQYFGPTVSAPALPTADGMSVNDEGLRPFNFA